MWPRDGGAWWDGHISRDMAAKGDMAGTWWRTWRRRHGSDAGGHMAATWQREGAAWEHHGTVDGAGAGAWQRGRGEHGRDVAARGSNMAATWQREGGIMAAAWQRHGRERAGTRQRHGSEPADGDGYGEGRDGGEGDRAGPQRSCVQHALLRNRPRRRDTRCRIARDTAHLTAQVGGALPHRPARPLLPHCSDGAGERGGH